MSQGDRPTSAGRRAAIAGSLSLLAGCSPQYNWREIQAGLEGYAVLLPDRPASISRRINLEGLQIDMTMQGAEVDDNSFAVGAVRLPSTDAGARAKAAGAMRAQMVRNIGGRETAASEVAIPVVDRKGARIGTVTATRIEASGQARGKPMTLLAGFAGRGDRVYQYVVLGSNPDREQASTFLDSFKLLE
jgi:hypothetical protein